MKARFLFILLAATIVLSAGVTSFGVGALPVYPEPVSGGRRAAPSSQSDASPSAYARVDRDRLAAHLEKSRQGLEDVTRGLTPEQWTFKPAPDRWSLAEVVEHLAASEEFLWQILQQRVLATPATPEKQNPLAQLEGDFNILRNIPDRTNRAQAPEPLAPTNRFGSPQEAWKQFAAARRRTIDFVRSTKTDLRSHLLDSPVQRDMDGHQWLLFASAHTLRHTAQAAEVKQHPGFPK